MKVKELIERLQSEDEESEVLFSYNYGDYWRTQVAARITEVEELPVEDCDRLGMKRVIDNDGEETIDDLDWAVILSS